MKFTYIFLCFFYISILNAQNKSEIYIEKYKDIAIAEMNEYGIPASITLAQAILESGNGESRLAREGNNHFGIKCHNDWTGETIIEDDDEKGECFRKYKNADESFRDHSLFLTQRGRYTFLFDYDVSNYKKWARGLKKAGYATNPKYASLLIDLIKRYDLSKYDIVNYNERKIFISNIYGAPYLFGLGLNYYDKKQLIDLNLQSSLVFLNKASLSYNSKTYNKLFLGITSGIVFFDKEDLNINFGTQISYIDNKKEKHRKITLGLDFIIQDEFNFDNVLFLPYLTFSNLF